MFTVNDLQDANVVIYDYYNPMDRNSVTFNPSKKSVTALETDYLQKQPEVGEFRESAPLTFEQVNVG